MADEPLAPDDATGAAESIDALLDRIDSDAIEASPRERAYLAGSRDTLRRLGTGSTTGRPDAEADLSTGTTHGVAP